MRYPEIYTKVGVFVFSSFDEKTGLSRVVSRHRIATGQTDIFMTEASTEFARLLLENSYIWDFGAQRLLKVGEFSKDKDFDRKIRHTTVKASERRSALPTFYHLPLHQDHEGRYQQQFSMFPITSDEEWHEKRKDYLHDFLREYKYVTHLYYMDDSFDTYSHESQSFIDLICDCAAKTSLPVHFVEHLNELPMW